ncbi:unnamed protein product [Enterobius vermicularis]|uniref:Protein-tyrosine-phosphatase n=1 Tax=Enterobius vermicularis TaxID=51028 RepID=A0A0N4VED1_ENTVE|nr:unnamed protein product [Enterobius vermicularis]
MHLAQRYYGNRRLTLFRMLNYDVSAVLFCIFSLVRQSHSGDTEVWKDLNAVSGMVVCDLTSDTLYALKISAVGWENDTMNNTVHFFTLESSNFELLNVAQLQAFILAISRSKPLTANFYVLKISLRGAVRSSPPGILIGDDFPTAQELACANDDGKFMHPINAELFSDTYLCKFGPLKPNRNYTATVWAENKAGRSIAANFTGSCVTPYGRPDSVVAPTVSSGNTTSFELKFDHEQDEANGPIVCFYLAIVPLLESVSIDSLPQPDSLPCDMFNQAMSNNYFLKVDSSQKQVYFAYIAESYARYPNSTVVGDGNPSGDIEPCKVPYLSRYRAEDMPLRPHVKYTGFLIARVEKNIGDQKTVLKHSSSTDERKKRRMRKKVKRYSSFFYHSTEKISGGPQSASRMSGSIKPVFSHGPEYAYSAYFKPIILKSDIGKSLPRTERFHKACASKLPENREKNRYSDKHTFDDTRVKLKVLDGSPVSDYINANYVNGYKNKKKFIATQGPKDCTQADFWRMVWEQDARIIVMITKLQEGSQRQCSQYWPDRESSKIYGDYEVCHVVENVYPDYVVREFEIHPFKKPSVNGSLNGHSAIVTYVTEHENNVVVEPSTVTVTRSSSEHGSEKSSKLNVNYENLRSTKNSQGNSYQRLSTAAGESDEGEKLEPRKIVQYHFISWPDFGTPKCTMSFLRFVLKLRKIEEFNSHYVIVHCSAGCGRTGTFIAIDSLLDQCAEKDKADIFGFVSQLRNARGGMIQNAAQYRFIYRALTTWYLYGNTDVEAKNFREHYNKLLQPAEERRQSNGLSSTVVAALFKSGTGSRESVSVLDGKSVTRMEEEFKVCFQTVLLTQTRLQILLDPPPRISFAYEQHNVVKNRFEDAVPYDYCRGHYFNFILAQDPVSENTCYDFWQMIDKFRSKIIVMLSNDNEFAPNERYWPNEVGKAVTFGTKDEVSVKLVEESLANEAKPTHILRKITYKFAQEKFYHEVTQFDYLCWPKGRATPTSMKSLICLIDLVLESQVNHDKDVFMSPIVLHSRNGSFETGIFCCITLLLERLRSEQLVDVFQTVRSLQRCRPGIITSLEQYKFCYEAVVEYLDSKRSPSR